MRERGTGVFLMPGTPLALKPWPPGAASVQRRRRPATSS